MTSFELSSHTKGLGMKVMVITGWQLPASNEYITIFENQLKEKLIDTYRDMNVDELEYALREYGTQIKDWGKAMNLALIDEAIQAYLSQRRQMSEYEERIRIERETAKIDTSTPESTEWSEQWEKVKESARNGQINSPFVFIPTDLFDWLERTGRISLTPAEKWELMSDCAGDHIGDMEVALLNGGIRTPQVTEKMEMLKNGEWRKDPDLKASLITLAKQKAVRELAIAEILNDDTENDTDRNYNPQPEAAP